VTRREDANLRCGGDALVVRTAVRACCSNGVAGKVTSCWSWTQEGDNGGARPQGRTWTVHGELADAPTPMWRISGSPVAAWDDRVRECGRLVERTIDGEFSRRIFEYLQIYVRTSYEDSYVYIGAGPEPQTLTEIIRLYLVVKSFLDLATITLSFILNNYYSIINYLNSKNSFRKLQINVISFCSRLHLILKIRYDALKKLNFRWN
jgi:hypothetical protein